ncbi:MAG: hypothetical protein P8N02_11675 [Actinomycetota bacterium]|nr:hypothetical protein [Actinomycetota bacterium]
MPSQDVSPQHPDSAAAAPSHPLWQRVTHLLTNPQSADEHTAAHTAAPGSIPGMAPKRPFDDALDHTDLSKLPPPPAEPNTELLTELLPPPPLDLDTPDLLGELLSLDDELRAPDFTEDAHLLSHPPSIAEAEEIAELTDLAPLFDDDFERALHIDLDAVPLFDPPSLETGYLETDTFVGTDNDTFVGTDEATAEQQAGLLATIARGHARRKAALTGAGSDLPDMAVDSFRIVPISRPAADTLLPTDAITIDLADGIIGAVAIARAGSTDFVAARHCHRWGITPEMAQSVALASTRQPGEISLDVVLVDGAEALVFESELPIAAAALDWLGDVIDEALPLGTLILIPSPHLMIVQPSRTRSEIAAKTLLEFADTESSSPSELLPAMMLRQTEDGLRIVGDQSSAAGRLGLTVAAAELTST